MKEVTITTANRLRELGFDEPCSKWVCRVNGDEKFERKFMTDCHPTRNSEVRSTYCICIPTVDQVIDWIRKKYNINIHVKAEKLSRMTRFVALGERIFDNYVSLPMMLSDRCVEIDSAKRIAINKVLREYANDSAK